jgi:hypothetical protein
MFQAVIFAMQLFLLGWYLCQADIFVKPSYFSSRYPYQAVIFT